MELPDCRNSLDLVVRGVQEDQAVADLDSRQALESISADVDHKQVLNEALGHFEEVVQRDVD